ncbi:MAG TPA: hypothetical protein VK081_07235 [Planctomycetota bacterium]|nr:hypothetical protein [Planctomycetota bacterium]
MVAFDTNGNAGGGTFAPDNAVGPPSGLGTGSSSTHVHSLGAGGWLILGLGVPMVDGPGADFLVAENPFMASPGQTYAELMFVEVSSNGVDFARFPSRFFGGDGSAFAINTVGFVSGLAGQTPVFANPNNPSVDPQDVVEAGGDAFDLADLRNHPLVVSGAVRLDNIVQIRLVDVVSGQSVDSRGRTILDPSAGSADCDAITVIHHAGNVSGSGPQVDVHIPQDGNFTIAIGDPDGLDDLDPASLRVSLYGLPVDPGALLSIMTVRQLTTRLVVWELGGPLPPGWFLQLGVSVKDRSGTRSGQVRQRPLN